MVEADSRHRSDVAVVARDDGPEQRLRQRVVLLLADVGRRGVDDEIRQPLVEVRRQHVPRPRNAVGVIARAVLSAAGVAGEEPRVDEARRRLASGRPVDLGQVAPDEHLLVRPGLGAHAVRDLRIGDARFEISRLLSTPEPGNTAPSWVAYSSFAELRQASKAQKHYHFEFATPTAFSMGQKQWGKLLKVFPEPSYVFGSLARQWDLFAPASLCMASSGITPPEIGAWCEEYVIVSRYSLETCYLPSSKFGQSGFQGNVIYEVKGLPTAPEALWLSSLARFALFSGVGYKTTMGMGQTRCTNITEVPLKNEATEEVSI